MKRSKLFTITSVLLVIITGATLTGCQKSKQEAPASKQTEKSGNTAPAASNTSNSGSSSTSIPQNGLVLYYSFDETSGTTANDSSPSKKNAAVSGATWGSGKNGNAIIFDGVDDYVEMPEGVIAGLKKAFTVSAWVNLNTLASAQKIFEFNAGSTTENFMKMALNSAAGKIRFGIKGSSSTKEKVALTPEGSVTTNKWTHIAVTSDGNTGIIYIDGVKQAEVTDIGIAPADIGITTTNQIARSATSKDPFLNAKMDDFCIYNRALSADEIAKMAK